MAVVRSWWRRHAGMLASLLIGLVVVAGAVSYQANRDGGQDARDRTDAEARVAACERGNGIRRSQRLDNDLAIEALARALATDPTLSPQARKRYAQQLRERRHLAPQLAPFPCERLREQPNLVRARTTKTN